MATGRQVNGKPVDNKAQCVGLAMGFGVAVGVVVVVVGPTSLAVIRW